MCHKSCLDKFEKIGIISSIFSDHNTVKLVINYRKKKTIKNKNIWRLNNMLLTNQQTLKKSKRKSKYALEKNKNENMTTQNLLDAIKKQR